MGQADRLSAPTARRVVTPPGCAEDVWQERLDSLPRKDFGVLAGELAGDPNARMLVVSAHPDDETLGGGRLIADWVRSGRRAYAVTATAGEACFDHVGHVDASLAQVRMREWYAALEVLGVEPKGSLDLPDGALQQHLQALIARVREIVEIVQPHVIAGTLVEDPHPDHSAVGRAVAQIAAGYGIASIEWPIWLTYFGEPPGPAALEVVECSGEAVGVRTRAWECFDSQRYAVSDELTAVVPPELFARTREQWIVRGPR